MAKINDQEVAGLIENEAKRQVDGLELIPSENYVSSDVLQALGSVFTNKYSEGYPHKRYYGGQEFADKLEELAIKRAQELFKTDYHVNVQPYSGSPGNLEIYFGLLEFGDKVLGMSLSEGGHLTHGNPSNFSGRAYKFIGYGVNDDEVINYDQVCEIALRERPKMIVSGATAYPRQIDFQKFDAIAKEIGAYHMADISHVAGLIAGGVHPSPFGFADVVMTTTHKTLRGPRGAVIFCKPELAEKIDKAVFPGMQGGPHMHQIAGKAIAFREASSQEFKNYATQVVKNSQALAKALTNKGYQLSSGGSENHLILLKLAPGAGVFAQQALEVAGITLNKNTIPKEPMSPFYPSGVRLGTPAITSRGMKEKEMEKVAEWIDRGLQEIARYKIPENKEERKEYVKKAKAELAKNEKLQKIAQEIKEFAADFPVPGIG